MRWIVFIVFAVLVVTLQTALIPRLALFGVRPDWLLIAVVFLGLYVPKRDAVLGAWLLGALADPMTIERLGLIALTYVLVALAVASIREYLFRYHFVTQLVVTLCTCILVRLAWLGYRRILYDPASPLIVEMAVDVLAVSIYTAVWAPLLLKGLLRVGHLFGVTLPRYTYAGLHRAGGAHV